MARFIHLKALSIVKLSIQLNSVYQATQIVAKCEDTCANRLGMHKSFTPRLYSGDEWEQNPWNRRENSTVNNALSKSP